MTAVYVGPGGNDSNSGLSYALRKLTLAGAEALALVGGDRVWCAPGAYRETLTPAKSGGSLYTTGTVSVTNGSKVVTGSGTTFTGGSGAFADGVFQVTQLAHGTDGVTNGTSTFTSAAGNFQASMIGLTIRINTKKAYIISAVGSATSITITDPDGTAGAPTAGSSLTYDVGPESPYRISTVDSTTQLTLFRAWSGPTLTGVAYATWQDIRYSADVTGQNTDGVGGVVRITGSNNDQTATRGNCILGSGSQNYRTFQGFACDTVTGYFVSASAAQAAWIFEDCVFSVTSGGAIIFSGGATYTQLTIRRCVISDAYNTVLQFTTTATQDNCAILVENCHIIGGQANNLIYTQRAGGILVRNCTLHAAGVGCRVNIALTVGQAMTVNNCLLFNNSLGLQATATGELIEDYNSLAKNATDRTNVTVGSHSNAFIPLFQPPPLLANGRVEPWTPFSLAAASGLRDLAGLFPPATDLYGTLRPQGLNSDWGAVEAQPLLETDTSAGLSEYEIPGRGYLDVLLNVVTGVSYTITASVRWDNNANIGTKPSMTVLADYGVAETSVSATGTGSAETLTIAGITPTINAALPGGVMVVRLFNNSTHTAAIDVYFTAVSVA